MATIAVLYDVQYICCLSHTAYISSRCKSIDVHWGVDVVGGPRKIGLHDALSLYTHFLVEVTITFFITTVTVFGLF